MSIGVTLDEVEGPDTVRILSVRPVRKSAALELVDVVAFKPSELGAAIVADVYPPPAFSGHFFRPHPLSDVVLQPGSAPDWQILVALKSGSIGLHTISGLRVTYEIRGKTHSQVWAHTLELDVIDCSLPERREEFVCRGEGITPRSS